MILRSPSSLIFLVLLSVPLALTGCGGRPETAANQDQLDAYLQANPEVADEEPPEIETE